MIHLQHLSYTYPGAPCPALSDVTLHIDEGEFLLVVGPSGAGKSTLLRCLNGLVPHFSGGVVEGSIAVAGRDPIAEGPPVLSRIVGFVFQNPEAQFVVDRVEDEVAFALENRAIPPREMRERVEQALADLDLLPLRNRRPETLSGGEKQRVALAAVLALRPRVLVLDEPTSQLDPPSADELLRTLVRLNREQGLTIILAEHRLERVLPYVDRVVYVPGPGEPVVSGPPRAVLREMELTPPVVTLAKRLGWEPLPLTVAEGQAFATNARGREAPVPDSHPPATGSPLLEIKGLSFAYDQPTLREVNLQVHQGELMALMGANGSGKTTLLRCIVGLLRPQEGRIELDGEGLIGRETAAICRSVGYLPQRPDDLLFAETVAEELQVTLRNHELEDSPPIPPVDLLNRLGIPHLTGSYPRDLSVGERQRVALGAVTVTAPQLLLLDEPTRGMDYAAKEELLDLLRKWQAEGTGVLLVTHDVELVARAADRVAIIDRGQIIAEGDPAEVLIPPSPFAPQMARLFPGAGWLTVGDALRRLAR